MSASHKTIDFEVLKEPWNKYEISDGSVLKTKFILKKIQVKELSEKKANFNIDSQNLTVIYPATELKGEPDNKAYSPVELKKAVKKEDLRYNISQEEWNEYLLDDATRIRVKTTVIRISRTSKFDKVGDPIYLVDTSAIVDIKRPKPLA